MEAGRMAKDGKVIGTCQSCGMTMHKYGLEKDGTPSKDYCLRCYRAGEFTLPDATIEQMVRISAQTLMDNDPAIKQEDAILQMEEVLPTLKRWNDRPRPKAQAA
jgi:hypothetical protein